MNYNKVGGGAFAAWGLIHIAVGGLALVIFTTGGSNPLLEFVDLTPALNDQSVRMGHLVAEFYQALLLIGVTVTVLGVTLNWRGEPLGRWLNALLVVSIDSFFVWFEVIPGHRPVSVAVLSIALLVVGVIGCWLGIRTSADRTVTGQEQIV